MTTASDRQSVKRPRTSSSLLEITQKYDELWFDDGSIVLAVVDNGTRHIFKVHKSLLAKHSPVFRDMFTLPCPTSDETYEGLPVVAMPDSFRDLCDLLRVLYDPSFLPFRRHRRDAIAQVKGVLKLSLKYQIDHLYKRIVDHLSQDWPTTLERWNENQRQLQVEAIDTSHAVDPAEVVALARECDIPEVLPAALYALTCCVPVDEHDACYPVSVADFSLLSRDDLQRLLRYQRRLPQLLSAWDDKFTREQMFGDGCINGCHRLIEESFSRFRDGLQPSHSFYRFYNPLGELASLCHSISRLPTGKDPYIISPLLCGNCEVSILEGVKTEARRFWLGLPDMFNL